MARVLPAAIAAALIVAPAASFAQQQDQPETPKAEKKQARQAKKEQMKMGKLLGSLHQINQMEIEGAQMAQEKSNNPQVQEMARTIVQDHQRLDQQLTQFAESQQMEMMPPDNPTAEAMKTAHDEQKQALEQLQGNEFDAAFVSAQPFMHRFGLATIEQGRQEMQGNQELMQLLDQAEQSMQRHLQLAERMVTTQMQVASEPTQPQGG